MYIICSRGGATGNLAVETQYPCLSVSPRHACGLHLLAWLQHSKHILVCVLTLWVAKYCGAL